MTMGEVDRRREQLDADSAGALLFPSHPGCAGAQHRGDGAPRPCVAEPVGTVAHRYEHPRRRTVRLFVCEAHAVGYLDPRSLTDDDRAELRRRRAVYRRRPGGSQRGGSGWP
ncbi:MAG: hypothetical protein M3Y48_14270 [Actinomycetota bacterium]|nr:hypothetical protein [Actinomycetota bacterium]